jgi:hypothetical protein
LPAGTALLRHNFPHPSNAGGGGGSTEALSTLRGSFTHENIHFRDLCDEVLTTKSDMQEMLNGISRLDKYYKTMQDERQNRTLNLLTLITSVFVPVELLTGLYGLNFVNMPKLGWYYSYYVFLAVIAPTSAGIRDYLVRSADGRTGLQLCFAARFILRR